MTLRSIARQLAKRGAQAANLDVHRLDLAHPARRAAAMRAQGVDVVLDVGANCGQYVRWLRQSGYSGRIVSFEPIPEMFEAMERALAADVGWIGVQAAVGAVAGHVALNVSGDTVTSSILTPRQSLTSRIQSAEPERTTEVEVVTIDGVWPDHVGEKSSVLLKVDVQGFEHSVLDGALRSLPHVALLEIEMGLTQLYEGGSTLYDLLPRVHALGFEIVSLDCGYVDASSGQVLDIDMLLARPSKPIE